MIVFLTTSTRPSRPRSRQISKLKSKDQSLAPEHTSPQRSPWLFLLSMPAFLGLRISMDGSKKELATYVTNGGTLIMACLLSGFARPPQLDAFYSRIVLPWRFGDYHRTTFYRNPASRALFGPQLHTSLKDYYSMKAVHLKYTTPSTRVYVPEASSRIQSMVFESTEADLQQCPAIFAPYGKGYIGYIRDVNNEECSRKLLAAMLRKF